MIVRKREPAAEAIIAGQQPPVERKAALREAEKNKKLRCFIVVTP